MFARKITNATTLTAKSPWKPGHVTRNWLPMVREHGKQRGQNLEKLPSCSSLELQIPPLPLKD
jgi:hypothetical protein